MEIITNKFLKAITLNPSQELYNCGESEEVKLIDEKISKEIDKYFWHTLTYNTQLRTYLETCSDIEKLEIFKIVSITYFFKQIERPKLESQLKLCMDFIESDICKRNTTLKNESDKEALKLKEALRTDFVTLVVNTLYFSLKNADLKLSDRKIYIKISEILARIDIYKDTPFLTLEQAQEFVDNHPELSSTAESKIVDRIKKLITKETNL